MAHVRQAPDGWLVVGGRGSRTGTPCGRAAGELRRSLGERHAHGAAGRDPGLDRPGRGSQRRLAGAVLHEPGPDQQPQPDLRGAAAGLLNRPRCAAGRCSGRPGSRHPTRVRPAGQPPPHDSSAGRVDRRDDGNDATRTDPVLSTCTSGCRLMPGPVEFAVWAPRPERVRLQVHGAVHEMSRDDDGWWRAQVEAAPEADYGFLPDHNETPRPDPRSRRQPEGVHGLSRRFDLGVHAWGDGAWTGRPLAGGVVYELHVGTFTPEGTFDAAVERLDHLVALGI